MSNESIELRQRCLEEPPCESPRGTYAYMRLDGMVIRNFLMKMLLMTCQS